MKDRCIEVSKNKFGYRPYSDSILRLCLPPLMVTQTAPSKVIQRAPCLDFSREIDLDSMLAWTVYFINKC